MPALNFVLPHWLYWSGMLLFPLLAWWLSARQRKHPPDSRPSLFTAGFFWLLAGYLGIHRFYLRSAWGFVFIPVFLGIIYCNGQEREVRDETSRTFAEMERAQNDASQTPALIAQRKAAYEQAQAVTDHWHDTGRNVAILLAAMLLVDGALLPRMVRRRRALEDASPSHQPLAAPELHEGGVGEDPTLAVHTRFTDTIDRFNAAIGKYVAWWAIIAVFVYYYEVMARYVFNSPTNWVHESMFLMFGMQYMLCGAYAYREDQHVRVDIVYANFSPRGKALADIVTSVFFFIFLITMLWTGARFALDAIQLGEHSFTEWGVQYWPIKLAIPVGAFLMTLQGISKLVKDIIIVTRRS
jgi:TRAP-type mannitol/chloroaromatic compound transport system permease small subunit